MIRIRKQSILDHQYYEMDLPITEEEYWDWIDRKKMGTDKLIQEEWPQLSPEQREFLLTGITPEEWNKNIVPEEDE